MLGTIANLAALNRYTLCTSAIASSNGSAISAANEPKHLWSNDRERSNRFETALANADFRGE